MCRNDKKLLRYELKLDLFGKVMDQPDSTLEESSVGRVFVNLAKDESPSRWKRLLKDNNTKPNNMNIWWDIYEKHQKDLDGHAPEDEDDDNNNSEENEENDDDATIVKSKKPKGGKKGGKKKESNHNHSISIHISPAKIVCLTFFSCVQGKQRKNQQHQQSSKKSSDPSWYNPLSWF